MIKKNLLKHFIIFAFYFLILLGVATLVRDTRNQADAYNTTLQQISESGFGYGDIKSFATAAQDIAKNGWISDANSWIFNLWPPAFVLLEALVVKVAGQATPIIFIMQIIAVTLLAAFMAFFRYSLRQFIKPSIALLLPLLMMSFPMPRAFLLQPYGVVWGETFAISCFVIGLVFSIQSIQKKAINQAIYAGIFIGLSAYFRSQFAIFILALTCSGLAFAAWMHFRRLHSNKISSENFLDLKYLIKNIVVIILAIHLTMLPWRLYHLVHNHNTSWVDTSDVTFANALHSTKYFEEVHAGFVSEGGGNLVCRIDPTTCESSGKAKLLFIKTFLMHPLQWYSLKSEIIGKYWFSSTENLVSVSQGPATIDIVANSVFLIALIGVIIFSFVPLMMRHQLWYLLAWLNFSVLSANILIFTVQQFEVRYFCFIKIYALVMITVQIALFFHLKKQPQNN